MRWSPTVKILLLYSLSKEIGRCVRGAEPFVQVVDLDDMWARCVLVGLLLARQAEARSYNKIIGES